MTALCESPAKVFGLQEIDISDGEIVSLKEFGSQRSGKFTYNAFPLTLRCFVLCHPKAFGDPDFNLIFPRAPLRLTARTPHHEAPCGAPAKLDPGKLALVPGSGSFERPSDLREGVNASYRASTRNSKERSPCTFFIDPSHHASW